MRHESNIAQFDQGGTYVDLDVAAKQVRFGRVSAAVVVDVKKSSRYQCIYDCFLIMVRLLKVARYLEGCAALLVDVLYGGTIRDDCQVELGTTSTAGRCRPLLLMVGTGHSPAFDAFERKIDASVRDASLNAP